MSLRDQAIARMVAATYRPDRDNAADGEDLFYDHHRFYYQAGQDTLDALLDFLTEQQLHDEIADCPTYYDGCNCAGRVRALGHRGCGGEGRRNPVIPVPNWEGADMSPGEHRTTGGRAWCHDDTMWCYPDDMCPCCLDADEKWVLCEHCEGTGYVSGEGVPQP